MKKATKRIILILFSLILCSCAVFAAGCGAKVGDIMDKIINGSDNSGDTSGGGGGSITIEPQIAYEPSNDGSYYIAKGVGKLTGEIVIESTYEGKPVTTIKSRGFSNLTITAVTIPDSVVKIEKEAFYYCRNLRSVTIGGAATYGENAFDFCSALERVNIADLSSWYASRFENEKANPVYFAKNLYANGTLLTELSIPSTLNTISDFAFVNCESLRSVTISSTTQTFGRSVFDGCKNIEGVYIFDILNWCEKVFADEKSNPLYYGKKLYLDGVAVTELTFTSNTGVRNYAFINCIDLTRISFSSELFYIANKVFYGCTSLSQVEINSQNGTVGDESFTNCPIENVTASISVLSKIPKTNLKTVMITAGDFVEREMFANCTNLQKLVFSDSITSIEYKAFSGCTSLSEIEFGTGLRTVERLAFEKCTSLKKLELTDGIVSMESDAFNNCPIEEAKLPCAATFSFNKALKKLEITTGGTLNNYFGDCTRLTDIIFHKSVYFNVNTLSYSPIENATVSSNVVANLPKKKLKNLVINGGTEIESNALNDYELLECLSLPSTVTSFASGIPYSLNTLQVAADNPTYFSAGTCLFEKTTLTLVRGNPNGIPQDVDFTAIGDNAFENCDQTTEMTLPESVLTIGDYAFSGCTALLTINLPANLTEIGGYAFINCTSMTGIVIPDNITSIGNYAFKNCRSLASIKISDKLTKISQGMFENCSSLKELTIPDSVTVISYRAFSQCSNLAKITLSANLITLEEGAFYMCRKLETVTFNADISAWIAIDKPNDWAEHILALTVNCTDGTIGVQEQTAA